MRDRCRIMAWSAICVVGHVVGSGVPIPPIDRAVPGFFAVYMLFVAALVLFLPERKGGPTP